MPLFRYEAVDSQGKTIVGAMQVADEQAVATRLTAMGYQPTTVFRSQTGGAKTAAIRTPQAILGQTAATAPPLSRLYADDRAVAAMLFQLGMSFRAGMPAYQAVTTVAAQACNASLRKCLSEIAVVIQYGGTLSGAMEQYPRIFTPGDVGTVRAAERGGFLPEAFKLLSELHEEESKSKRRLSIFVWFFHINFLCLPPVLALMKFLSTLIMSLVGTGSTEQLLHKAVHDSLITFLTVSLPMMLAYVGGLIGVRYALRDLRRATRWHKFLLGMPYLGKLTQLRARAIFSRMLQYLYHAGVMPATAWETAAGTIPNRYLAEQMLAIKPVVEGTGRFSMGMQQTSLIDPADVGMVATGEATGDIPQALNYLANRYEEETRVAMGAAVVRVSISLVAWTFVLGGIVTVMLYNSYLTSALTAASKLAE